MLRRSVSTSSAASEASEASPSEKVATSKLIDRGHENFDLIFMMLMGIRTSVGKFANVQRLLGDLTTSDFDQKWDGDFLAKGSADTPAHGNQDFRFRDFSPLVFRQIRERFGVTTEEYLLSLTSEYVLVEMFTNSKSGSFFFYSADYRFILKTCTKREAAFLISALPQYHQHLMANRYTLLCRFFGLHRVHLPTALGKKVYFVVMGNVFPIDKPIHERYDLKGSTRGRVTSEEERSDPNVVLKDLDWIRSGRKLHLGPDKKRRLLAQVKKDCALLERLEVIDYSLLVGIHRSTSTRQPSREKEASRFYKVASGKPSSRVKSSESGSTGSASSSGKEAAAASSRWAGGASGGAADAHVACRAATSTDEPSPAVGPSSSRASVQIVEAVSQQQLHREYQRKNSGELSARSDRGSEPDEPEVGKEIYFMGCIDILCEYSLKKQLEHHYKAAKHGEKVGAQNFSVVDPLQYATRFQNFVAEALD